MGKDFLDSTVHSYGGLPASCDSIGIDSITFGKMRGEQK